MFEYKDHPVFDYYDYVIGNDPGTLSGLSIFDRFGLVSAGVTKAQPSTFKLEQRAVGLAYALMDEVHQVCGGSKILFAIEYNVVYSVQRAGAALTQRELIGVIAAYAHKYGYDVERVSPTAAKLALTGNGKAKKTPDMVDAAKDVCKLTMDGFSSNAKREAVADSIGIAFAGMKQYVATKGE